MKVVHCKKEPFDVYIGRPSIWGNPFKEGVDGNRSEVVRKYKKYFLGRTDLKEKLLKLPRDTVLACWCKPKECHGDVLVDFYERSKMAKRARNVVPKKKASTKKAAPKKSSKKKTAKGSSPFMKALKSKKAAYKKFKKAKKGGNFETSDIPDGTYECRWSAKCGVSQKSSEPYVSLNWVVTKGKYKGEKGNRYFDLGKDEQWEWLSSMLQSLLDEDTSGLGDDPEGIKDWIDQVNDVHPLTETNIKRSDDGRFLNAYVQALLEDEEGDEEDDEEEEGDEEEYEEEDEEESDEEEEESDEEEYEEEDEEESEEDEEYEEDGEEEEEEEIEIAKGDEVSYKPPKSRKTWNCTVTRVNKTKRTCALESEDGEKTFKDVSWDDVETA